MEDCISFETAELAWEKGFNLESRYVVNKNGYSRSFDFTGSDFFEIENTLDAILNTSKPHYLAPTRALLQKWLREEHKLHVIAVPSTIEIGGWYYHRFDLDGLDRDSEPELVDRYSTYEEAFEQGLLFALKKI